ncbi:MAG: hypothetical protein H6Q42_3751, partial [Deltaproteobacteria bacterium]|nr:hypothetical protein [Deltaproteobacteria bacterium]
VPEKMELKIFTAESAETAEKYESKGK